MRKKKLPSTGKEGRRRYYLHYRLRKKGLLVNVNERTIIYHSQPSGIVKRYCEELKKYGYEIQLSII